MHKLLTRQIRRYFGATETVPDDVRPFAAAVDESYERADADHALLEHSIETLSAEMQERYQDLTDALATSRRVETELVDTLSVLTATLECTTDGIMRVDAAGNAIGWNAKCRAAWNLPELPEPSTPRTMVELVSAHVTDGDLLRRRANELAEHPGDESFDTLETTDGRTIEAYSQPHRVLDSIVGRVWSFRDVTARRKLEDRLHHRHRIEAVGQLAGGVAHDFNNLLTVIGACSDFLDEMLVGNDAAREEVCQIKDAAERAAQLTRQLLTFSRRQVIRPVRLDPGALVDGLRPMLGRLIGEDITLQSSVAAGVDPVMADAGTLEQVLVNLVVNARDAMPRGGVITVSVTNESVSGGAIDCVDGTVIPGDYVRLSVRDDGTGIPSDVLPLIFDPFFTTKAPGEGTGLGLATVQTIVRQAGGGLVVETAPDAGTTFTVYLPSAAGVDTEESGPVIARNNADSGETIVLAEDDETVRAIAVRALRRHNYRVLVARNGAEALDLVLKNAVDVVVTDVVMPGMNGLELRARLTELRPEVGVLLTSGYTPNEISRRAGVSDDVHILAKPFTGRELLAAVRETLDQVAFEAATASRGA